jgi:glycine/D-amino acid oxidase-like deaminating enzyme
MRIVITAKLSDQELYECLASNVEYRPDLERKSQTIFLAELIAADADAVIYRNDKHEAIIAAWRSRSRRYSVRIAPDVPAGRLASVVEQSHFVVENLDAKAAIVEALRWLEDRHLQAIGERRQATGACCDDITFVGAGITNLVAAFLAARHGFRARIYDASPDPSGDASWRRHGCSHGGDDARMFTLSEMDNYNDRQISESMNDVFNKDLLSHGWNISGGYGISLEEKKWIERYETIPPWLADKYNEDIFSLNRRSGELWDQWIRDEFDVFGSAEFRKDILRIYSCPSHFEYARARQDGIGATLAVLSVKGVADAEPSLADAVRDGAIAGGVLVRGFTVNIHKFMANLIRHMTSVGVEFIWGTSVDEIIWTDCGRVRGMMCGETMLRSSHYVISPGAYGNRLIASTRCAGRIHGVLGAWLRLPNLEPRLQRSLKLARKGHITEDANVTVATDRHKKPVLIIGSGYGHTGSDPSNVDRALLESMYEGVIDTARQYFPRAFLRAKEDGTLATSLKYCVRPWTANSLGLFEVNETEAGGRLIVSGGHNTGGFAQAPVLAEAILATLRGQDHPVQTLYAPARSDEFLDRSRAEQAAEYLPRRFHVSEADAILKIAV